MSRRGHIKYLPVAALGIIAFGWLASLFFQNFAIDLNLWPGAAPRGRSCTWVWLGQGTVGFTHVPIHSSRLQTQMFNLEPRNGPITLQSICGRLSVQRFKGNLQFAVPIHWLILGGLPIAAGALTGFKFTLRMWAVWVLLVAAACAFLRPPVLVNLTRRPPSFGYGPPMAFALRHHVWAEALVNG